MLYSLWLLFSYTPILSWPSSPTPSSFNEQGKEWLPLIESARTLLSLFSLLKHAHVTLTFFIFFAVLAGENVQTRSCIWYTIVYGPTAFIFPPPELFGRLTEAKTSLCWFCLENMKAKGIALRGLVAGLPSPGYNLYRKKQKQNWESKLAGNLKAFSTVSGITTSDTRTTVPTYRTIKLQQIMCEHWKREQ